MGAEATRPGLLFFLSPRARSDVWAAAAARRVPSHTHTHTRRLALRLILVSVARRLSCCSVLVSQIGFIDHVVAPMFVLIKKFIEPEEKSMGSDEHGAECLDLVTECVTQLKENRSTWVGIKAGGAPPEPEPAAAAAAADGAAKAEPEPAAVVEEADKEEDLE